MSRPSLLRRNSSISARIDEQGTAHKFAITQENEANGRSKIKSEELFPATRPRPHEYQEVLEGVEDCTDTDNVSSPGDIDTDELEAEQNADKEHQINRVSKRILSMKRHGRYGLNRIKSEKFLYFANDCLAVRAQGKEFYLCRTLEDVPESKDGFNIAWFDVVDKKEQIYKVSYDDICYQSSVIERVIITELSDGTFQLAKKYAKQIKKLLREALEAENLNPESYDFVDDNFDVDGYDDNDDGTEDETITSTNGNDDFQPKRKRQKLDQAEELERRAKEEKNKKARKFAAKQLVPNLDIKLVDKDPLFEEKNDLPIAPVKRGVKAVLLDDMEMLKDAINDTENVYTVFWNRSEHVKLGPVHYALLHGNKEALKILSQKNHPKQRKAKAPHGYVKRRDISIYSTRDKDAYRAHWLLHRKEKIDPYECEEDIIPFCMEKNISPELIELLYPDPGDLDRIMKHIELAISCGNRNLAVFFLKVADANGRLAEFGFNFLHLEVLEKDTEPLSSFQTKDVTATANNKYGVTPLHCAAINPNPKYLAQLLEAYPQYHSLYKFERGRKTRLIHYAAACEGPGPLKLLLSRPNTYPVLEEGFNHYAVLKTPLMVAAKFGRMENVKILLPINQRQENNDNAVVSDSDSETEWDAEEEEEWDSREDNTVERTEEDVEEDEEEEAEAEAWKNMEEDNFEEECAEEEIIEEYHMEEEKTAEELCQRMEEEENMEAMMEEDNVGEYNAKEENADMENVEEDSVEQKEVEEEEDVEEENVEDKNANKENMEGKNAVQAKAKTDVEEEVEEYFERLQEEEDMEDMMEEDYVEEENTEKDNVEEENVEEENNVEESAEQERAEVDGVQEEDVEAQAQALEEREQQENAEDGNAEEENAEEQANIARARAQVAADINRRLMDKHTALHYAAENGHVNIVRWIIQAGATVEPKHALEMAAMHGHLNVIEMFAELGDEEVFKLDMRKVRKTPLVFAAMNGHYRIMAFLLRIGVNPDAPDSSRSTPMHYAAAHGWYHCVQLLLDAGAEPNVMNEYQISPFEAAVCTHNFCCADLLLSRLSDVESRNDKGVTLLMRQFLSFSLWEKLLENITYLIKNGASVDAEDEEHSTALHYLASRIVHRVYPAKRSRNDKDEKFDQESSDKCNEIARVLVNAGADVNAVDKNGCTPLMSALLKKNYPLAECLLEIGANSSGVDLHDMRTPLHHLFLWNKYNRKELIEVFDDVRSFSDHDRRSKETMDELFEMHHDTAINKKFCKILLEKGVDVNACTKEGKSALLMAVEQEMPEICQFLISNGASLKYGRNMVNQNIFHVMASCCKPCDWSKQLSFMQRSGLVKEEMINQVDDDGYTPLLLACEAVAMCGSDKDAAQHIKSFIHVLIEECDANVEAVVMTKIIDDNEYRRLYNEKYKLRQLYSWIKEDKSENDVKFTFTGGFSCLHFLALVIEQTDDVVNLIKMIANRLKVNLKANPNALSLNAKCRYGRTALHQAIKSRHLIAVQKSLYPGVEDDDVTENPLSMAAKSDHKLDAVDVLLLAGLDPNARDGKDGKTALSYAVENVLGSAASARNPLDLIRTLIKAGADVNSSDNNGRTPLHHLVNASSGGYEALAEAEELLLKHGADPSAIDATGRTPLFYAFYKLGREDDTSAIDPISIVTLLCECDHVKEKQCLDAMLSQRDVLGRKLIHYAALRGASVSCCRLIKYSPLGYDKDVDGNTPLTLALRSGHHDCALLLLQQEKSSAAGDVITSATREQLEQYEENLGNKWKCVKNKGQLRRPKSERKSSFQFTLEKDWFGLAYLMLASDCIPFLEVFRASLNATKLQLTWTLLKKQRKPGMFHEVDEKKCNLMHVLAAHADTDMSDDGLIIQIAKFLMDKGVYSNAFDVDRITPLHLAAHHAHFGLCKLLLSADSSLLDEANKDGMTPLAAIFDAAMKEKAFERKHVKLIKYFIERGVNTLDVCYYTRTLENEDKPESTTILNDLILFRNVGNFSQNSFNDDEPFEESTETLGPVEYLLANGADINFTNHEGLNPMMVAIKSNSAAMVELLLRYEQIDLDAKTKDGKSFVHLCVGSIEGFIHENTRIFELLKEKGASIEEVDIEGNPPIYYAMRQSSGTMANLFPALLRELWEIKAD